jgi:hypothetical protein
VKSWLVVWDEWKEEELRLIDRLPLGVTCYGRPHLGSTDREVVSFFFGKRGLDWREGSRQSEA